jgi:predicted nucleic acid-binding protein
MIVADASLLAHLLIPGLDQVSAEAVHQRDSHWCAPGLWPYEFRHTLLKYIRAKGLNQEQANNLMTHACAGMDTLPTDAPSSNVIATALAFGISAYDAEYVALAQALGAPLITYDQKLVRATRGIALSPADFIR